jgi:hypothetical protein
MFDAAIIYAGKARLLADVPLALVTAESSLVYYLVQNIRIADGPAMAPAFLQVCQHRLTEPTYWISYP